MSTTTNLGKRLASWVILILIILAVVIFFYYIGLGIMYLDSVFTSIKVPVDMIPKKESHYLGHALLGLASTICTLFCILITTFVVLGVRDEFIRPIIKGIEDTFLNK